jgi:hypothetical protein
VVSRGGFSFVEPQGRRHVGVRLVEYQRVRKGAGISNRTINMDVAALRRVLKRAGRWRAPEQHVEQLREAQSLIRRALTGEEEKRLLGAAASNPEWAHRAEEVLRSLSHAELETVQ